MVGQCWPDNVSQPRNRSGMERTMIKVTVVIPNYNGIRFLPECLGSLERQAPDTPPYEILVVDNGSTDGSLELLEQEFPRVRVIALPENTGFCHAVNAGIKASQAPYVLLLNNDTKVSPSFVRALVEAIERYPAGFSVSAKMLMWDRPDLIDDAGDRYCVLGWAFARGKGKPAADYDQSVEIFAACGGAAIYRRAVLEEIGLFDEQHFAYLEDIDIGYRARIYGYRNYYEPSAEVVHYGSASSGSRYNEFKTLLAAANNVYLIGKNMPLLQWVWNLPFLLIGFLVKFFFFGRKKMGFLYLKGLGQGIKKLFSEAGSRQKLHFQWRRLPAYLAIQGQLYVNLFRFLKKS